MGKNTKTKRYWTPSMGKPLFLIPVSDKGGMGIEPTKAFMDELLITASSWANGDEDGTTGAIIRGRSENDGVACYDLREGEGKSAMMGGYTRMIEARTNSEARRINGEIKKNAIYICETPLDAIDRCDQAQQRGEEVYFRPPTFVFFGKEAVDRFDAMREEEDRQREGVQAALEEGVPSLNADEVKQDARMLGYVRKHSVGYDIKIDPRKIEALENAARRMHFSTIDDGEPKPHLHNVFPNCVRHELPPEDTRVVIHTFRPRTKGKSSFAGLLTAKDSLRLPLAGTVFDPRRYRRIK